MGTLYVIGTPIGNLGDISARAADLLRSVDLVVAEDTRVTRKLLNHLGATARCVSYHQHSAPARLQQVLAALDRGDVAQVTDAGSPSVSDPGPSLVKAAAERGHDVVAIPGPSAITAALSISGHPGDRFTFLGFLPRRSADRRRLLEGMGADAGTLVAFETAHRIVPALKDVAAALGDRAIAVCREMTKAHEEVYRGSSAAAAEHFASSVPRGEFVLVIEGAAPVTAEVADDSIVEAIDRLSADGTSGRTLVDAVVRETGAGRSRVYRMVNRNGPRGGGKA